MRDKMIYSVQPEKTWNAINFTQFAKHEKASRDSEYPMITLIQKIWNDESIQDIDLCYLLIYMGALQQKQFNVLDGGKKGDVYGA